MSVEQEVKLSPEGARAPNESSLLKVSPFPVPEAKFSGSVDSERAMGMDIMGEQAEK
jgi:hypothetical protein